MRTPLKNVCFEAFQRPAKEIVPQRCYVVELMRGDRWPSPEVGTTVGQASRSVPNVGIDALQRDDRHPERYIRDDQLICGSTGREQVERSLPPLQRVVVLRSGERGESTMFKNAGAHHIVPCRHEREPSRCRREIIELKVHARYFECSFDGDRVVEAARGNALQFGSAFRALSQPHQGCPMQHRDDRRPGVIGGVEPFEGRPCFPIFAKPDQGARRKDCCVEAQPCIARSSGSATRMNAAREVACKKRLGCGGQALIRFFVRKSERRRR